MNVMILGSGTQQVVASGSLPSGKTSGYLVSGFNEYQVNFSTPGNNAVTASNIAPESSVQFEINGG
jgi:hypothetical protein